MPQPHHSLCLSHPTRPTSKGLRAAAFSVSMLALALSGCAGFVGTQPMAPVESAQPVVRPSAVVQVMPGDTVPALSRRYGVTREQIIKANGLRAPYKLQPGSTVTVPETGIHVVRPGENLGSIGQKYGVSRTTLVQANALKDPNNLKAGQRIKIPKVAVTAPRTIAAAQAQQPALPPHLLQPTKPNLLQKRGSVPVSAHQLSPAPIAGTYTVPAAASPVAQPLPAAPAPRQTRLAMPMLKPVVDTQVADLADEPYVPPSSTGTHSGTGGPLLSAPPKAPPQPKPEPKAQHLAALEPSSKPLDAPGSATATNVFIWPVQGTVISGFGASQNGARNDGINIAVEAGTDIRASDEGTVAYAGNELAGYGNLLLIKHSNGYVTAYAHNSRLLVKRGETVAQGQVIAKAGATGDVDRPQLHFEIRRGDKAVNPKIYLQSANASL